MYNSTDHPPLDDPNVFILYRYHPSLAAAIIFIVCFSFTTAFHIFQLFRFRTWFFIPLIVGGLFELVGYVGRVVSSQNQWLLSPYIMQTLLILVAPALFAATIYMTLGRIILLLQGEKHAVIRPKRLTKIFVSGDVLCFLVQAGSAGILATKSKNSLKLRQAIVIVGLCIQIVSFGFFVISATIFHRRTKSSSLPAAAPQAWEKYLFVLYAASILILVRSVFRVIEYAVGNDGYML
ncbi:hypothetical protein MMC08_009038 [Hypocenomyce scalaris]|nr:hypothetical protein [Hypocenomyce scalaris]